MIEVFLKNICLITFALVGPVTLPAGGIQRNLSDCKLLKDPKEIILSSNCSLHAFPKTNAKKLTELYSGSSLSILRKWNNNESEIWFRVQLVKNQFIENPNKISRGWIKI